MKIKVGDWVLIDGRVGRVTRGSTPDDFHTWIEVDGVMQVVSDVEKLSIKFKGFNILFRTDGDREVWDCYRTVKDIGSIHFICIFDSTQFYTGYKVKYERFVDVYLKTADQARDWLELQYATLLAKARGLV